jgi:hypothetical protein
MRYPASEKLEIIRLAPSSFPVTCVPRAHAKSANARSSFWFPGSCEVKPSTLGSEL